ncbi:uncharacterized protein LOC103524116 [Trichonephila clavipes]|nr:uncharacterized protein LOC103524116 [Trichonephila clavipes]
MKDIQIKIGYTYLLMALPQLRLVRLEPVFSPTPLILKNLLDNFDGEIYAIFMAFRAISTTPGLNIVIFIDSQAAIKTVSGYNLFPSNLSSSANNLSTLFFAPEERSFSNGSHLIAVFMETNKLAKEASTLHPPCHSMPLRNAKRLLMDKLRQKRISTLTDLAVGKPWSCLLNGQRFAQLSALFRVEGVACFRIITGHDYLQAHLFKIGLVDSPLCSLCNSVPMTGEYLSAVPALLHVLSQDNWSSPSC